FVSHRFRVPACQYDAYPSLFDCHITVHRCESRAVQRRVGELLVDGSSASSEYQVDGRGLRRDNIAVGLIHLIQVIVLVILSNDFSLPVTESFLSGPPGLTDPSAPEVLWDLPLGYAVALFLLLASVDH